MCEVFNHYDYPSYFHAALLTTPQVSGCPRRGQVRLDRFDGSRCFRARHQVGRSPGVMVRAKRGPSRGSRAALWARRCGPAGYKLRGFMILIKWIIRKYPYRFISEETIEFLSALSVVDNA